MNIAALVSGGVDSALALARLKGAGHTITAFYLKIWLEDEVSFLGTCPWEEDLAYVRTLCEQQGVRLEVVPLQRAYWDQVVAHTIAEISAGRTPNPDILCNQRVKFGAFYEAIGNEFDRVATGHYARMVMDGDSATLRRAPDPIKDQTYFLSQLSQGQLRRALFPIGDLAKAQVRELAQNYGLPQAERPDSQGICFLGKIKFRDFVKAHVGERMGDIVEYESRKKLGTHEGFWFYTIGQRTGLRLAGGPWYVVAKDPVQNIIYASRSYYDTDKVRDSFFVEAPHWIRESVPTQSELLVRMRHGPRLTPATITYTPDGVAVQLHERDQGIAPGQYAVFYHDDECLGGGVISLSPVRPNE
jgi:tRNA-specific 2-thiouridylase